MQFYNRFPVYITAKITTKPSTEIANKERITFRNFQSSSRHQDVRLRPRPRHQPARGVQEEKGGELDLLKMPHRMVSTFNFNVTSGSIWHWMNACIVNAFLRWFISSFRNAHLCVTRTLKPASKEEIFHLFILAIEVFLFLVSHARQSFENIILSSSKL